MWNLAVKFFWKDIAYTIPADTQFSKILLPNGIVLHFNGFLETHPPKLNQLIALSFTVSVQPDTDLKAIAEDLEAVLATEIGFCPNHPEQTGNFCSICGKRITTPTIYHPKPFPFMVGPLAITGNGPCPHCQQPLDHSKDYGNDCPHCRGKLKWTCR